MNILVLAAGDRLVDEIEPSGFPSILLEVNGELHIEKIIKRLESIKNSNLVFTVNQNDIDKYAVDKTISLLSESVKVIGINHSTAGAACTALLAAEYIDKGEELLILNGNEILNIDYLKTLDEMRNRKFEAGIVTFDSVHPRYSYVTLDESGFVVDAAEKIPISRNAVAGFYYFKSGANFVTAIKDMIRASDSVNNRYFVTPALNYLALRGIEIGTISIPTSNYHPLKSYNQLKRYEMQQGDQLN